MACKTKPSAGTLSPSETNTKSPVTSSLQGTLTRTPSLMTSACGLDKSFKASSALPVLRSWYHSMPIIKRTKPISMSPSCRSPNTRYKLPQAINSRNMGSLNTPTN
ncbi:MAG: hypothetical protein BWY72_02125 [Bacteroidetes bacterium ADurb.Bin416]|nr:MAG: hypothetical protein BWY72_02125 [Bacteroidetes bacterium ADurb.Bin416]